MGLLFKKMMIYFLPNQKLSQLHFRSDIKKPPEGEPYMDKIDFVLPWVDGSDKDWIALKNKYKAAVNGELSHDPEANADCRYRDYGLLKYWFRGVERFAPWVNRVFFVTCGQKPDWLDESNPKLRLVNHTDYGLYSGRLSADIPCKPH